MQLPHEILAFQLLKQAEITNEELLLIHIGMNYNNRDQLYEQAHKSLKKFKGDQVNPSSNNSDTIIFDLTFLSQHEEVLAAAGYIPQSKFNKSKIKQSTTINSYNKKPNQNCQNSNFLAERRKNPTDQNSKVLICIAYGSYSHLLNDCPDSWKNSFKTNYIKTDDVCTIENNPAPKPINPVIFTGNNENKKTKNYGPFLWMWFNCFKARALRGGSLPFTTKFPEIPGTHFIDPEGMKGSNTGALDWESSALTTRPLIHVTYY